MTELPEEVTSLIAHACDNLLLFQNYSYVEVILGLLNELEIHFKFHKDTSILKKIQALKEEVISKAGELNRIEEGC